MKKKYFLVTCSLLLVACFLPLVTCSLSLVPSLYGMDIYLELKSTGKKINIAFDDMNGSETSSKIFGIVNSDLVFSGMFNIADPAGKQVYENKFDFSKKDRDEAALRGIDTLVKFEVAPAEKNISLVSGGWDVASAKKIFGDNYSFPSGDRRGLAHSFSQDIVKYLTGQEVKFNSKIAFSSTFSGKKEIWCSDYDGGNLKRLTYHNSISILPKFSADGRYLFYTTYKAGNPDVFKYDFKKGASVSFLDYQGINIVNSFSADGRYFIATLSKDGDPELYLFTADGNIIRRLTFSVGVDAGASFSPNSREFVFTSGRSGSPNLYIMDIEGANLRKLTHGGYNDSPCWSPLGDKIVFAKRWAHGFDVFLTDVATQKEWQLTRDSASNENPVFSPDGRYIAFASNRRGKWEIFRMPLDGSRQVPLESAPKNSVNPVWSPR